MLLEDADSSVRYNATEALCATGWVPDEALPLFTRMLDEEEDYIRWAGVRGLGAMGPRAEAAVPRLLELLRGEEENVPIRTINEALVEIRAPLPVDSDRTP